MPPIPPIFTARGITTVTWKPAWTLILTSEDGLSLDSDGEPHTLTVSLLHSISGAPQVGRQILLETTPSGRVGDKQIRFIESNGRCTFTVSDEDDESVLYRASVMTASAITDTLTIDWGGGEYTLVIDPPAGYWDTPGPNSYKYHFADATLPVIATLLRDGSPAPFKSLTYLFSGFLSGVSNTTPTTDINGQFFIDALYQPLLPGDVAAASMYWHLDDPSQDFDETAIPALPTLIWNDS